MRRREAHVLMLGEFGHAGSEGRLPQDRHLQVKWRFTESSCSAVIFRLG